MAVGQDQPGSFWGMRFGNPTIGSPSSWFFGDLHKATGATHSQISLSATFPGLTRDQPEAMGMILSGFGLKALAIV